MNKDITDDKLFNVINTLTNIFEANREAEVNVKQYKIAELKAMQEIGTLHDKSWKALYEFSSLVPSIYGIKDLRYEKVCFYIFIGEFEAFIERYLDKLHEYEGSYDKAKYTTRCVLEYMKTGEDVVFDKIKWSSPKVIDSAKQAIELFENWYYCKSF